VNNTLISIQRVRLPENCLNFFVKFFSTYLQFRLIFNFMERMSFHFCQFWERALSRSLFRLL